MKKRIVILVLLAALMVPLGVGWARGAEIGYQIPWDAYASGGEQMDSSHYRITGMAGQSLVGSTSSDSGQEIGAGFWTVFTETLYKIFLPLVVR